MQGIPNDVICYVAGSEPVKFCVISYPGTTGLERCQFFTFKEFIDYIFSAHGPHWLDRVEFELPNGHRFYEARKSATDSVMVERFCSWWRTEIIDAIKERRESPGK